MKARYAVILGVTLGVIGSMFGFAAIARTAPEPERYGPPVGPQMARDTGPGEVLVAVVGGVYETAEEATAANDAMAFGDLQGYYVIAADQFGGFREQLEQDGEFTLVSVFRTDRGAYEFANLAMSFGYPASILPERVQSFGGQYAGLGQEANLQGTGPLLGPIPDSLPVAESET